MNQQGYYQQGPPPPQQAYYQAPPSGKHHNPCFLAATWDQKEWREVSVTELMKRGGTG